VKNYKPSTFKLRFQTESSPRGSGEEVLPVEGANTVEKPSETSPDALPENKKKIPRNFSLGSPKILSRNNYQHETSPQDPESPKEDSIKNYKKGSNLPRFPSTPSERNRLSPDPDPPVQDETAQRPTPEITKDSKKEAQKSSIMDNFLPNRKTLYVRDEDDKQTNEAILNDEANDTLNDEMETVEDDTARKKRKILRILSREKGRLVRKRAFTTTKSRRFKLLLLPRKNRGNRNCWDRRRG